VSKLDCTLGILYIVNPVKSLSTEVHTREDGSFVYTISVVGLEHGYRELFMFESNRLTTSIE